jgi:hypothetical protein
MTSVKTVGLIAGSVAVATFAFGLAFAAVPSHATIRTATVSAPAVKAHVVRVTGEDFKFDAPDVVPAGLTEFRFLNKGPAIHHMQLLKLSGGKTVDDLRAALANPGPPPAWMKQVGGPNAPAPGLESNATMMLEPGDYALICFVDLGGPPHFMKGMVRALRVGPASGPAATKLRADVTALVGKFLLKPRHLSIMLSIFPLPFVPERAPFAFTTRPSSPTKSSWCSWLPEPVLETS